MSASVLLLSPVLGSCGPVMLARHAGCLRPWSRLSLRCRPPRSRRPFLSPTSPSSWGEAVMNTCAAFPAKGKGGLGRAGWGRTRRGALGRLGQGQRQAGPFPCQQPGLPP